MKNVSLIIIFIIITESLYGQAGGNFPANFPAPASGVSASQIARAASRYVSAPHSVNDFTHGILVGRDADKSTVYEYNFLDRNVEGEESIAILSKRDDGGAYELQLVKDDALGQYELKIVLYDEVETKNLVEFVPIEESLEWSVSLKERLWKSEVDQILKDARMVNADFESFQNKILLKVFEQVGTDEFPEPLGLNQTIVDGYNRMKGEIPNEASYLFSDFEKFLNASIARDVRYVSAGEFAAYQMGIKRLNSYASYIVRKPRLYTLPYGTQYFERFDETLTTYNPSETTPYIWTEAGEIHIEAEVKNYLNREESFIALRDKSGAKIGVFDREIRQFRDVSDSDLIWRPIRIDEKYRWVRRRHLSTMDGPLFPGQDDDNSALVDDDLAEKIKKVVSQGGDDINYIGTDLADVRLQTVVEEVEKTADDKSWRKLSLIDLNSADGKYPELAMWNDISHKYVPTSLGAKTLKIRNTFEVSDNRFRNEYEAKFDEVLKEYVIEKSSFSYLYGQRRLVFFKLSETEGTKELYERFKTEGMVEYDPVTGEMVALIKPLNSGDGVVVAAKYDNDLGKFVEEKRDGTKYIWDHLSEVENGADLPKTYGIENYRRRELDEEPDEEPEVDQEDVDMGEVRDDGVVVGSEDVEPITAGQQPGYRSEDDPDVEEMFAQNREQHADPANELSTADVNQAQANQVRQDIEGESGNFEIQSDNINSSGNLSESQSLNVRSERLEEEDEEPQPEEEDEEPQPEDGMEDVNLDNYDNWIDEYYSAEKREREAGGIDEQPRAKRFRPDFSDCE